MNAPENAQELRWRCSNCDYRITASRASIEVMPCPSCNIRHYWTGSIPVDPAPQNKAPQDYTQAGIKETETATSIPSGVSDEELERLAQEFTSDETLKTLFCDDMNFSAARYSFKAGYKAAWAQKEEELTNFVQQALGLTAGHIAKLTARIEKLREALKQVLSNAADNSQPWAKLHDEFQKARAALAADDRERT